MRGFSTVARGVLALLGSWMLAACGPQDALPGFSGPQPIPIPEPERAPAFLQVEAEAFDGPWSRQSNLVPFYGEGFVTSNAGRLADTVMSATVALAPGRFAVWTRGYRDSTDRSFQVRVGSSTLAATHGARTGPAGFEWVKAGEVELEGGDVALQIRDYGVAFEAPDAIILSGDLDFDPLREEEALRVLDPAVAERMVLEDLVARARSYAAEVPVPSSRIDWAVRAATVRRRVLRAIGLDPPPERTPLEVEAHGTVRFDGYRLEKLSFQSRPGLRVTAHVFVPDGPGPFPAVVSPIGHYFDWAKADHRAAARAHALARLGFVSLIYDPFGQGERQGVGTGHSEHWRFLLSGNTNLSIMVWDTIRAVDYLVSRADVDASRIGCTGASGGGLNALFASIADERITASAPAAYVTTFEAFLSTAEAHDACTFVPGVAGFTHMGELVALVAPRPQRVLAGELDPYFPLAGTEVAMAFASGVYDLLGAPDALDLNTARVPHEYARPLREAFYGFARAYLMGTGSGAPVAEPDFRLPAPNAPELFCFEGGRVPAGTTPRDLSRRWAEEAASVLPSPEEMDASEVQAELLDRMYARPPTFDAQVEERGPYQTPAGLRVQKVAIRISERVVLPAYFSPGRADAPVFVVVAGSGLPTLSELVPFAAAELPALLLSPRGRGETQWVEDMMLADGMLLGDTLLGQRAADLAAVRQALADWAPTREVPAVLIAYGAEPAMTALFAQALFGAYEAAALGPITPSYLEAFGRGIPRAIVVPGILQVADVPHVAQLAQGRPLSITWQGDERSRDVWTEAAVEWGRSAARLR